MASRISSAYLSPELILQEVIVIPLVTSSLCKVSEMLRSAEAHVLDNFWTQDLHHIHIGLNVFAGNIERLDGFISEPRANRDGRIGFKQQFQVY